MSDERKLSEYLRLTDNHPTAVKVAKLCEFADQLGISITFHSQRVVVDDRDRDSKLPPLYLEDIEDGHWFSEFPFNTEYKLIYQNPEWVALRKKEQEERDRQLAEKARLDREREAVRKKTEEERRAKELERQERAQLAALRKKYGE